MLRCCDFYCANLLEGMEGTELLKIETSGNDPITTTRVGKGRRQDAQLNNKGKKTDVVVVVGVVGTKDNKEIENREMSVKEPPPDNNKRTTDNHPPPPLPPPNQVCEKPDEGCEKVDGTKESQDDMTMKEDSISDRDVLPCSDISNKESNESAEMEDVSYSEDNSVDNNTFNIINTENSESQEFSEMTNDDVSSPPPTDSKSAYKENGDEVDFRENGDSEFGTQTEVSDDEISCLEDEDVSEDSAESDGDDLSSGSESDDEEDFDNDSLEDRRSQTESSISSKGPPRLIKGIPRPLRALISAHAPSNAQVTAPAKQPEPVEKPASPKFRHRPRLRSFGKKDSGEFKIEIFESKRKPQVVPSIHVADEAPRDQGNALDSNKPLGLDQTKYQRAKLTSSVSADQLVTPDALSSSSDFTTPDSADNTCSMPLDATQGIGEESGGSGRPSSKPSPDGSVRKDIEHSNKDLDRKTPSVSPDNPPSSIPANSDVLHPGKTRPVSEDSQRHHLSSFNSTTANEGTSPSSKSPSAGTHNDDAQEEINAPGETKKPTPMAFTIDLGGGGGGQADTPKKLDITASISKWAPKHRRNLSLTKVEEHKKVEERIGKPPVGRPRSGTIGATGLFQGRRAGGYHSEGYFSSDQDDEAPRRTAELKSPRSPRTPELRSPQTPQRLVRSTSQDSAKGASLKKQPGKPEGRTCCKADKKPTVAEVTGRTKSEKGTKSTLKMTPEARKQSTSANSLSSSQTYDVKLALGCNPGKEEPDDASETGTYTIEKDSSSPEVEQARNDIDRVFGVSGTESETEITPRGNAPSEEPWTPTPEADKFKSPGSLSRNSPNWIQQWAAQVAEHTKTPDAVSKASLGSPRGSKPPVASLSSSQESSESRPRRKLPTPPTHQLSFGLTSPRASDVSDHESPTKGRLLRDLYESPKMGQQSDFSRDTESYLRDTEQLVTSLQARMDMKAGVRGSSFESHDSGGDSDLDTSTSYPINDDDDRLMKTFSSQQKTKLKLSGIDSTSRTPPFSASPRKTDPLGLDSRIKLGSHFKRERSIVSDSGLRRARLGCEESTQQKSSLPVEKKKIALSASVGNVPGSRKTAVTSTKSHQSTRGDSQSQMSKSGSSNDFSRGDGGRFSLRLARSGSTNTVSKSVSHLQTVSKSPSHSSVRKELSNGMRRAPRSNSTLTSKEVDFQNWKRRKNYDPMKAAAEGKKKVVEKKNDKNCPSNGQSSSELRSPSPPGSLLRSASFHGTEGIGVSGRWPRRPNHLNTSEDDGPYSLEEEPHPVPHCSPLRRSPTSPHQLASPHITSPARQATLAAARARRSSYTHSDEGEGQGSPSRKPSLDESGSEGKRSPMGSSRCAVSGRSKAKMEALDNLVISTIHSLSVKVRTTSETLLQKLKSQYDEEGDRAALLEEVLAHLSESDQTLSSGQSRSTSRELAGILRNLKKIEHALEVIDRVMVGVDDDDLDDDLDGTAVHEWGESDY